MNTYDPTDEARGWHKYPAKTRHLRRCVQHEYTGTNTIALTDCTVIHPDGSMSDFRSKKITAGAPVSIRKKILRASITEYIATADRVNLDSLEVARLYRLRQDNGYEVANTRTVDITQTVGFRGGD